MSFARLDALARRPWLGALMALVTHGAALAFTFAFLPVSKVSMIGLFMRYGRDIVAGQVPYRDFALEYPPLAVPLFALPALVSHEVNGYRLAFGLEMAAFDFIGALVALWVVRKPALRLSPFWVILIQPLLLIAGGRELFVERFDIAAGVLVVCALALFGTQHRRWAWLILGAAIAVKLYPVVLLPLLAWSQWRKRAVRELAIGGALCALVVVGASLAVTRGDLLALSSFVEYHADRGLEIETLYSSVLLIEELAGHNTDAFGHLSSHGADELVAPAAPLFATLALPLSALAFILLYWRYTRVEDGRGTDSARFLRLTQYGALAVLIFMLAGKVLSPQYLYWLYPFVGIVGTTSFLFGVLFSGAMLATGWMFPAHWGDLLALEPLPVLALIIRNALLSATAIVVAWGRRGDKKHDMN